MAAADAVLVPVQCEFFALEGISQLKDSIEQIRATLNPRLEIQGVVLTMYDARTSLSREVADDVRAFFGDEGLRDGDPAQHARRRGAVARQADPALRLRLRRQPGLHPAGDRNHRARAALQSGLKSAVRSAYLEQNCNAGDDEADELRSAEEPARAWPCLFDRRTGTARTPPAARGRAAHGRDRGSHARARSIRARTSARTSLPSSPKSIRTKGLVQPIIVRPHGMSGRLRDRRRRAALARGAEGRACTTFRSSFASSTTAKFSSLRSSRTSSAQDLNAIEEATGYRELIERFDYSQEQLSEIIGKSRSHVANTLRLLKLPAAVQVARAAGSADRRACARADRPRRCRDARPEDHR